jgi:hypothetical protein
MQREEAMKTAELAIEYRSKGVCGVDLCGNPLVRIRGVPHTHSLSHSVQMYAHSHANTIGG